MTMMMMMTVEYSCVLRFAVKILSVDKGFYVPGGQQLFGKFKSLKHCMKECAATPNCFSGDYNPWLHKCYQHSNITACNSLKSHPQFVHFRKVPCCKSNAIIITSPISTSYIISKGFSRE